MNTNPDSSDPLFDQLLDEALGGPAPPDLSFTIMEKLRAVSTDLSASELTHTSVRLHPVVDTKPIGTKPTKHTPAKGSPVSVALWVSLASMAAMVFLLLYFVLSDGRTNESPTTVLDADSNLDGGGVGVGKLGLTPSNDKPRSDRDLDSVSPGQTQIAKTPPVTLDLPEFASSGASGAGSDVGEGSSKSVSTPSVAISVSYPAPPAALEDQQVVEQINSRLVSFWGSEGITPEAAVEPSVALERLAKVLGVRVLDASDLLESGSDAVSLYSAFQKPQVRDALAQRLAVALLGRVGARRVEPAQQEAFAQWLVPAVAGQRWDETVAALVRSRGSSQLTSEEFSPATVWFASLAGPRSVPLVEQFGHAVLDVDLRCGRCHDHPLDGRIAQESYWQLNAVFETGLRWSSDSGGGLRVDSPTTTADLASPVVFYELLDGRQRSVAPRVFPAWIGPHTSSTRVPASTRIPGSSREGKAIAVTELDQLAETLHNSPQVARAAVNCAWEIVYGRPLVGSSANPTAPAENPELVRLQHELAEQFRAHDFDMGRLICWVAAARPMHLQVPKAFLSPAFESASAQQLQAANHQLQNFAAFPLSMPQQEFGQLLAVVDLNQNPSDLVDGKSRELLGQIGFGGTNNSPTSIGSNQASNQRPSELDLLKASLATSTGGENVGLPAEWLGRLEGIAGYDLQSQHLYYLAGYWHPSARHMELAQSLRKNADSDSRALSQLWWILANEKL